jgi:hypothetical protein
MGSFYYRPIDPGYAELGAGLGAGIAGGTANFFGEREAGRERKRRDSRELLDFEINLLAQGGGLGDIPTRVGAARGPMQALMPRDEAAGGIPGESGLLQRPGVVMPGILQEREKPGYAAVGEGRFRGYLPTEEGRAATEAARATAGRATIRGEQRTEANENATRLANAIAILTKNQGSIDSPEELAAARDAWAAGIDPSEFFGPAEPTYEEKARIDARYRTQPRDWLDPNLAARLQTVEAINKQLADISDYTKADPARLAAEEERILRGWGHTRESFSQETGAVQVAFGVPRTVPTAARAPSASTLPRWEYDLTSFMGGGAQTGPFSDAAVLDAMRQNPNASPADIQKWLLSQRNSGR